MLAKFCRIEQREIRSRAMVMSQFIQHVTAFFNNHAWIEKQMNQKRFLKIHNQIKSTGWIVEDSAHRNTTCCCRYSASKTMNLAADFTNKKNKKKSWNASIVLINCWRNCSWCGVNKRRSLSALQQYADHGESHEEDVNDVHDCIG